MYNSTTIQSRSKCMGREDTVMSIDDGPSWQEHSSKSKAANEGSQFHAAEFEAGEKIGNQSSICLNQEVFFESEDICN